MTMFCVHSVSDQPQTGTSGVVRQGRRHGPRPSCTNAHPAGSLSSSQPGGPPCWASLSVHSRSSKIFFRASGGEGGWTTCLPWLSGGALSAASAPGGPPCWTSRLRPHCSQPRIFQSERGRGWMDDVPALAERGGAVRPRLCPRGRHQPQQEDHPQRGRRETRGTYSSNPCFQPMCD